MRRAQELVAEFHRKHNQVVNSSITCLDEKTRTLRSELIKEEARELLEALEEGNLVDIVDGLADLTYVVLGTAVSMGITLEDYFMEVHRSNMSKPVGEQRSDGKVLKETEDFQPPNIKEILLRSLRSRWQELSRMFSLPVCNSSERAKDFSNTANVMFKRMSLAGPIPWYTISFGIEQNTIDTLLNMGIVEEISIDGVKAYRLIGDFRKSF